MYFFLRSNLLVIFLLVNHVSFSQPSIELLEKNTFKIIVFHEGSAIKTGSGVLAYFSDENNANYCITNAHVLDGGDSAIAIFKEESIPIQMIHTIDYEIDFATFWLPRLFVKRNGLLKTTIERGPENKKLIKGAKVFAMSSPRGLEYSLSDGLISSVREKEKHTLIQFTAPISPGSSGGALVDDNGGLIGIITSQLNQSQNINFAISIWDIIESDNFHKGVKKEKDVNILFLENHKNNTIPLFKAIRKFQNDNDIESAYTLMQNNYSLISKSFGLMYDKLLFEHTNRMYIQYFATLKDIIKLYGFKGGLYLDLALFFDEFSTLNKSNLILIETDIKQLFENNPKEYILEGLLGNISYILNDFNIASSHLTRFTSYYDNLSPPSKIINYEGAEEFLKYRTCLVLVPSSYELLGDSWVNNKNLRLAQEAYEQAATKSYSSYKSNFPQLNNPSDHIPALWRRGMKAIKASMALKDYKEVCAIYFGLLFEIDPEGKQSALYKSCK